MNRFPFTSYPKGWYLVATSSELRAGEVRQLRFFGEDLVLFRTEKGVARLAKAYCPHLGAHLGVGGKVLGEEIRCPFHGWKFSVHGQCTSIPYCKTIPQRAELSLYPILEHSAAIFVYFDIEKKSPSYQIPVVSEFQEDAGWSKPIHLRYELTSHVQEMAENILDTGHFPLIHQYEKVPEVDQLEISDEKLKVVFRGHRRVFWLRNRVLVELDARGLGIVYGKTDTDYLRVRVVHAATPIDEQKIQVNLMFSFEKSWNPLLNLLLPFILPREVFNFTKGDHAVLNHKTYRERPLLCSGDGPIMRLRHWAEQFYPQKREERHETAAELQHFVS